MNERNLQIFSLIASILTLFYLILSYNGYMRLMSLYVRPLDSFVKNYKNIPKAVKDRVAVSISKIPKMPFIKSILDQTSRVDDIILTIPYSEIKHVPENLKKILTINGYSKDYDEATNLIYSVLREPEANTKIFLLNPDVIYGQDFIQTILETSKKNPKKLIKTNDNNCVMIKPNFFSCELSDYKKDDVNWLKKCKNCEDVIIEYNENRKI